MPWQLISNKGAAHERGISRELREPLNFMKRSLNIPYITPDQEKIVKSVWNNKFTGVKAAHSVGKTFIEACIAVTFLLTHNDSIVVTTAPTERQVRDLLWAEINNIFNKSNNDLGGKSRATGLSLAPKWFATGITTTAGNEEDSVVRFQGYHAKHILVIMDEAVGIHPAIWEAVDGITNSDNAKILAVGNPSTPNCAFKKHLDSGGWNVLTVSALNHPNVLEKREIIAGAVSYRWIKDKIKKWCVLVNSLNSELVDSLNGRLVDSLNSGLVNSCNEKIKAKETNQHINKLTNSLIFEFEGRWYKPNNLFLWKILGEFPQESIDVLIPGYKIREAMKLFDETKPPISPEVCVMSIDTARFGTDNSVIALFRDNYITHQTFYHLDTAKLTGEAINLIKRYNPAKVGIDCDGIGAGVFDNLNEAVSAEIIDTEIVEIHGGAIPADLGQSARGGEEFLNLRAQMYWLLRQDIDTLAIENNDEAQEGLSSIKYFFNSKGKIQIESKDDIRKRLGRSPDIEDALAYANFLKYSLASGYASFEEREEVNKFRKVTEMIGL